MVNYENLKKLSIAELRVLAGKQGVQIHHASSADKFINAILESLGRENNDMVKETVVEKKKELVIHTEEQVLNALKEQLKNDKFMATFPGDDTVIFKCNGAEESIHLSATLGLIKVKAASVAKGARRPVALNQHFDSMATSQSYTNNVLTTR